MFYVTPLGSGYCMVDVTNLRHVRLRILLFSGIDLVMISCS